MGFLRESRLPAGMTSAVEFKPSGTAVPAKNVTPTGGNEGTELSATVPAVTDGTAYSILVTAHGGTSTGAEANKFTGKTS
jgi:poly(3-hydroxybutyrate) depolymerase